jgi:hypothetical protein
MDDEILGHTIEEWFPMEPTLGPPLPKWLEIYWPWYKGVAPPPVVFTCPYCGATFATEAEMNYHIQTQHAAPPIYTCPYCGATFATEAERDSHVQTQHPAPPSLANLSGIIRNQTNQPIAWAVVILDSQTRTTGQDGYFEFLNLQPGSYSATAQAVGYETSVTSIDLVEGNNTLDFALVPIAPPPPGYANLIVKVKDAATNQPIAGAAVAIAGTSIGGTTDQTGSFQVRGLPVGVYVVTVEASGYESFAANIQVVEGENNLEAALEAVAIVPTQTGIMKLRVRTSGGSVESEVTFANLTGQAYRLNIPNADFFYVNVYSHPLGPGFRVFRMNVGDIVPEGISVWHGSVDSWALQELSGKTCIADCHFIQSPGQVGLQSFQGIVSSSWQEWQEIPYQPPYEPPGL